MFSLGRRIELALLGSRSRWGVVLGRYADCGWEAGLREGRFDVLGGEPPSVEGGCDRVVLFWGDRVRSSLSDHPSWLLGPARFHRWRPAERSGAGSSVLVTGSLLGPARAGREMAREDEDGKQGRRSVGLSRCVGPGRT